MNFEKVGTKTEKIEPENIASANDVLVALLKHEVDSEQSILKLEGAPPDKFT